MTVAQNATSAAESTETDTILEVNDLTKVYPDGTVAVEDISFEIERGDFCVLIGPSGCGKSTTLHSLVGRFPITEGEVILADEDITHAETHQRDIGLVFQDFQLFPHLTVEENIRYGLEQLGLPEDEQTERVDEMVEIMRLDEMRDRSPEELSAGQKQRVALSRSLVLEPQLLLLDEPLGDMDYKLQKRMERELLRIHREMDTTFVYVTHDQTQAMRLADQIIVMNDGKIEHSGSTDEVYNAPNTAFVSTFVGDSNVFTGELVDISDDGTRATLQTPFGAFTASTANLHSAPDSLLGEQIPFSVRPQYLEIGADGENVLACDVNDVIHQPGAGTQVLLTATNDAGETTELQLKSHEIIDVETDTVDITWRPEHATLLEQISVLPDVDLSEDVLGE
ncbi:ABC transporter ATP-binding protein [Natrinema sp. LN54]|uniref:ABC transporter ATP-binding protein n=1 Tax=Natrinema sp. LN54 TaxID=3458705 RepID=UPI00403647C8